MSGPGTPPPDNLPHKPPRISRKRRRYGTDTNDNSIESESKIIKTESESDNMTTLISENNSFAVRENLDSGVVDPNGQSYSGLTYLCFACCHPIPDIVKLLLKYGADVNKISQCGGTPLYYALQQNNYVIAKILLRYNANPNIGSGYFIPINQTIRWDNIDMLKLMLINGADPNLCRDDVNMPPLYRAIIRPNCSLSIVKLLLKYGAKPNLAIRNNNGNIVKTALHVACYSNNIEIVKLLLSHGCTLNNVKNENGRTPLQEACYHGNIEIVKLLLRNSSFRDNIDDVTINGKSSLMLAVEGNYYQIVTLLYIYGARPDITTIHDDNALQIAIRRNFDDIHRFLIDLESPIVEAINHYYHEDICWLLKHGLIEVNTYEMIGIVPQRVPTNSNDMIITQNLAKELAKPWRPNISSHSLFHSGFKNRAILLFLINQRNLANQVTLTSQKNLTNQGIQTSQKLKVLPIEMIFHVLSFCNRDFWNPLPLE
tara:strand:- start:561 stop:2015 length:1455 start_codon:yes stop_codon:yes gene_type:complete